MLVDIQFPVYNTGFCRPRMTRNSALSFKGKYQYPHEIHKLRCFSKKEDWKMLFSLSTIKKFHTEIVFVVWPRNLSWEVRKVFTLNHAKLKSTLTKSSVIFWKQPWFQGNSWISTLKSTLISKTQFLRIFRSTLISRQLEFFLGE